MAWKKPERFINSLDFQYLTNTIELDLSNIFGRGMFPSKKEINAFIAGEMKVTANMLRGVQHHPRFPKVHVQLETEEQVTAVEIRVKDGLVMEGKGIKIFGYKCDSPMVTVILNGQDMNIEKEEVSRVLGKYGTVVTCERGRNNDLSSEEKFVTDGTWTIRMTPLPRTKPPETVYYFGEHGQVQTWILNYDGVGSSCILCGMVGHMGFRCNSMVPRSGFGVRPAGFGKWTDVAAYQAAGGQVPVVGGRAEGQAPAVGAEPVQEQHDGNAGQVGRQPVSQEIRNRDRMAALDVRARQAGWGNPVPVQLAGQGGARGVQGAAQVAQGVQPAVVGPRVVAQEWETTGAKKKKRKRKKKTTKVVENEIATNNMFGALTDEDEIDEEEIVAKAKPETGFRTFIGRSSVGNRYGSRKNVQLVERYKKRKRLHRSTSVAKLRKKNPVNLETNDDLDTVMVDRLAVALGEELEEDLGAVADVAFVDASKGSKAAIEDNVDENLEVESTNLLVGDISVAGSTQGSDQSTNLLASNTMVAGSTQGSGQSSGLDSTQPGAGGGYGQSLGLDGSAEFGGGKGGEEGAFGQSVKLVKLDVDSQSTCSNFLDEHLEVKEKAEAIKAQLDMNKEVFESEKA